MALYVGARERRFHANRLRCPQGRATKIIWITLLLFILNLLYVSLEELRATATQQVPDDFSRNQDSLKEVKRLDLGVNPDERTAKDHVKQISLRPDEDSVKEISDESRKSTELAVNESNRSEHHPEQNEIARNASLMADDTLNAGEHAVEENAQPDHETMLSEGVADENKTRGDDPQLNENAVSDRMKPASDFVSDEQSIKESRQRAHDPGQDEQTAKQEMDPSDSLDTERNKESQETQESRAYDLRAAWLKHVQSLQKRPEEAILTIFDVCPKACRMMAPLNLSRELPLLKVETLDIAPKSVSLDDPPIPIIGTDQVHQRMVSGLDIAEFMAHVTIWRRVFHGDGGNGVFISCRVKDPIPLLKTLRNDQWFRNETEGGTMGNEGWDILLLGAGRPGAVPGGSIEMQAVRQSRIEEEDLLGYVVSQRGANELLRYVRAFTVPTKVFMSVVVEKGLKVMRWDGAGLGEIQACGGSKGESKNSAKLPFYPPVHWIHAAARDRKR